MKLTAEIVERCRRRERTRIGPFRADCMLGIGATAAVYEATPDEGTGRVALKVLHDELHTSKDACARLARQVDVSERVEHPGVLRVHRLVEADADTLLVTDLLAGETAAARLSRAPRGVAPADAVRWALGVLAALEVVHAQGILHRDIKPANVFLRDEGDAPVLIDFGSALVTDGGSLTRTVQYLGTPAFMPPELAAGHPRDADVRSDLWSLAATTFSLLTGEFVHPARSASQQLLYAATQPARSLRSVRAELDPHLVAVIDRALRFDPKERFSSARELADALRLSSLA